MPDEKADNRLTRFRSILGAWDHADHAATSSVFPVTAKSSKSAIIKKVARSIQNPTPQFKSYGLSRGCAKPIFDHAHEKSAKRQGEWG
jgi:hypothetical protein